MKHEFVSGLYKSRPDPRDYLMQTFLDPAISLPPNFSLRDTMPPVKNQGAEGSCAGQAGSICKEWQEELNYSKLIPLSARFIYEYAKDYSGHEEGTTLKAICRTLKEYGISEEALCPYEANGVVDISKDARDNAMTFKIKNYARIRNVDELKQTIYQKYPDGGPTIIGIKVFKGMVSDESRRTGIVPNPSCFDLWKPLGGHAIAATGWCDESPYYKNDGHIECQGSWGDKFGHGGYHYLSYKYIKDHMLDAMSMIDIKADIKHIRRVADMTMMEREASWV